MSERPRFEFRQRNFFYNPDKTVERHKFTSMLEILSKSQTTFNSLEKNLKNIEYNLQNNFKNQFNRPTDTFIIQSLSLKDLLPSTSRISLPPLTPAALVRVDIKPHVPQPQDLGYGILTDPRLRQELLQRTIAIIQEMDASGINTIVYADRGARPIATLVGALWSTITDREIPATFFINSDPKRAFLEDASDIPEAVIEELRTWLAEQHEDRDNPLRDGDARIAVVDENFSTGKTARFLGNVVKRAFPGTVTSVEGKWVNAFGIPWRNRADMIGVETEPGSFRSRQFVTATSQLLIEDLVALARNEARTRTGAVQ